jgi:hypothetical protein
MTKHKTCEIRRMVDIVFAKEPEAYETLPIDMLHCYDTAKHSVTIRTPDIGNHERLKFRLCDFHYNESLEGQSARNPINVPFTKHKENTV